MVMNVLFIYLFIYFAGTNIQTNEEVAIKLVSAFNQLGFVLYQNQNTFVICIY